MEVLVVAGAIVAFALYESGKTDDSKPKDDGSGSFKTLTPPISTGSTHSAPVSSQPTDPATTPTDPPVTSPPVTSPPVTSPPVTSPPTSPPVEPPKPQTYCLVSDTNGVWDFSSASYGVTRRISSCGPNGVNPAFHGSYVGGKYSGHYEGNFIDPYQKCTPKICDVNLLPKPQW